MNGWKKIRHRLEYLGLLLLARAVPLLSRKACVRVANFLGRAVFLLDRRSRAVALANLEEALGGACAPAQRREIALASFQNFARTMIDLFWSRRLTRENHERYIHFEGDKVIRELIAQGRGAVVIGTHCAGFEWAHMSCAYRGLAGRVLTEAFKNPALGGIFVSLREWTGHHTITQDFSMLRLFKHLKRGGIVGLLIDLNIPPTQAATVIDEFGMKTCATLLHAALAQRTGAPLVPFTSEPLPDGTCRVVLHPPLQIAPGATPREITQACWDFFEPRLREDPRLWMWAYKHWRYKPRNAARPYPFYANESSKFEKLLRATAASE
jgi:Kdo2-lipid IVA lauroyltransferase/acyltransferase